MLEISRPFARVSDSPSSKAIISVDTRYSTGVKKMMAKNTRYCVDEKDGKSHDEEVVQKARRG